MLSHGKRTLFSLLLASSALSQTSMAGNANQCSDFASSIAELGEFSSLRSYYVESPELFAEPNARLNEQQLADFKPFCRVDGAFEQRQGQDGKDYAIGFAVALPDNWNGRFLFQGGGGLNGVLHHPVGRATGNDVALFEGYAVATTDSGHLASRPFDPAFFSDQQAIENFWGAAIAKTTPIAKNIVTKYYGEDISNNYFAGCSTGGREAMVMSQRYPDLYDGIISMAPARVTNLSEIADLWVAKRLSIIPGVDPKKPFSDAQRNHIIDGLLEQCDNNDGLADGWIADVVGCNFDPSKLQCGNDKSEACLSKDQVEGLIDAFAGPRDADGNQIYPAFYFDHGIADNEHSFAPGLLFAKAGPLGATRFQEDWDIKRELDLAIGFPLEGGNATQTNIQQFVDRGGKIIFTHGVSDPWFSAKDTFEYFNAMNTEHGGAEKAAAFSQFYFVPGMAHCAGGSITYDSYDALSALVNWVEQDQAPQQIVAESRDGGQRPLCPHPKVSTYNGGDTKLASSFSCQ